MTNGFPVGFLRHLTPYWKASDDAKAPFHMAFGLETP